MHHSRKSLTLAALLSVCATGWSFISSTKASAELPTVPLELALAADQSVCSFITGNNVNIRSSPNPQSRVVTKLRRGDGVRALRRSGNWVQLTGRVTSPPGKMPEVVKPLNGWVSNQYINGCSEDQFERWRQ
ncbi:SH3 domain-containing protein [Allocoleopsis franciscana]|uniref:SH3 domain-containing protein n=1 Tax=Allocoleopsis franciscana PCC 7113 TaxID=1173027 RepID=K9WNW6_9CYAN|nr:SH3 domain-containing protein [Allocoleopsis franciscana]AFZ21888.1 SH3 domain-containing protein [Allocoleopsis franciscana PCC 7113]